MLKMESAVKREADELRGPWSGVEGNLTFTSKSLFSMTQMTDEFCFVLENLSSAFILCWFPDPLEENFSLQTYQVFKPLESIKIKTLL